MFSFELLNLFEKIPLLPHIEVVFERLKEQGMEIALISSGLPQNVIENLAKRLKAEGRISIDLRWGGTFGSKSFKGFDYPHMEAY